MDDDSKFSPDPGDIPYVGPVWPLTLENFERLNDEQRERFWWCATFVADSNDALSMLLMEAGIYHVGT